VWHFLDWKAAEKSGGEHYRPESDLARVLIQRALERHLEPAAVEFDYQAYGAIVSALEPIRGRSGWLESTKLTVESLEKEEYLIFAGRLDDGTPVDDELCHKLIAFPAQVVGSKVEQPIPDLSDLRQREIDARLQHVQTRNVRFFDEEVQKLDRWADDLKYGPERELKEIDREIGDARGVSPLLRRRSRRSLTPRR
jgi:adenine-specific DNA-methyltransferase